MSRNRRNHLQLKQPRLAGVAPPSLMRDDFMALDAKSTLRCAYDVEQLLLMQSIEGRAHEGHGAFYGRKFPNTTVDDVARSLRLDPGAVKEDRQLLIDEIVDFVRRAVAGEELRYACNTEGEPLLRCGFLRHLEIEARGVLQGLYLGGLRDEAEIRTLAGQRFRTEIGYGKCYLVDQKVLKRMGLDGYDLARNSHEHEIHEFEKEGLFAEHGDPDVAYMYVRYRMGPGASDDAAVVMAGKLYGLSAAIGCFFADAIDTLEKYVPEYKDQDAGIGALIEDRYGDLGVTRDNAIELAYLASIPGDMQGRLPDSSLRHMLEIEKSLDQCAVESHLCYVAGRPYSEMDLDRGECTNTEFYSYIERRLSEFQKSGR